MDKQHDDYVFATDRKGKKFVQQNGFLPYDSFHSTS